MTPSDTFQLKIGDRFRFLRDIGPNKAGDIAVFAGLWSLCAVKMTTENDPHVYFTAPLHGPDSIQDQTLLERVEDKSLLGTFEIGGATISLHKGERPSAPAPAEKSPEAPDWVRWLAYDNDGSLWGYDKKPEADDGVRRWTWKIGGQYPIKLMEATSPRCYRADWKSTLVEVKRAGNDFAATQVRQATASKVDADLTRIGLEQDLKAAASNLLEHMGAAAVTLPMQGGGEIRAGKTGDGELHLAVARGDEVRQLREQLAARDEELLKVRRRLDSALDTCRLSNDTASKAISERDELKKENGTLKILNENQYEVIKRYQGRELEVQIREQNRTIASLHEQLRQRTAERDAANAKLEEAGDVATLREQAHAWQEVATALNLASPGWRDRGPKSGTTIDAAVSEVKRLANDVAGLRIQLENRDQHITQVRRALCVEHGESLLAAIRAKLAELASLKADLVQAHDLRRAAENLAERRNRRIGGEPDERAGMPISMCAGGSAGSPGTSGNNATAEQSGGGAGGTRGECMLSIIELKPICC